MSSYFPNRWPLSYLNLTKNMKTCIRRQQQKNFQHQDIKQTNIKTNKQTNKKKQQPKTTNKKQKYCLRTTSNFAGLNRFSWFSWLGPELLSLRMRKPAICRYENKDADQQFADTKTKTQISCAANCGADQRLCFRHSDSTIPLLPRVLGPRGESLTSK